MHQTFDTQEQHLLVLVEPIQMPKQVLAEQMVLYLLVFSFKVFINHRAVMTPEQIYLIPLNGIIEEPWFVLEEMLELGLGLILQLPN
ncbi:MAG: hypothetical protein CME98_22715 [Hyphomonas sp.]|nr:hypothetical protein [Hyphomonas sp.]